MGLNKSIWLYLFISPDWDFIADPNIDPNNPTPPKVDNDEKDEFCIVFCAAAYTLEAGGWKYLFDTPNKPG